LLHQSALGTLSNSLKSCIKTRYFRLGPKKRASMQVICHFILKC